MYGAGGGNTNAYNETYYQFDFGSGRMLNNIKLYLSKEETKNRPRDFAIDVLTADGEYVRVAEKHNIEYSRTSSGFAQTDYYFPAMLAAGIRVTYNKVQDGAFINGSTPLVSPNEIQADYKSNVTTSMYTGIEASAAAGSGIPRYASKNYALGAGVTTSGRENTGNTASNLTDGKTTNRK